MPASPATPPRRLPPPGRAEAAEAPNPVLTLPGSTTVSCLLMEDTVVAKGLSVSPGQRKISLFANPFLNGKEEAIVIDRSNNLTYVQRDATDTGWLQTPVYRDGPSAGEAVVVVHPQDLTVWLLFNTGSWGLTALELTCTVEDGVTTCAWQERPDAVRYIGGKETGGLVHLSVFYDDRIPVVTGVMQRNNNVASVRAITDSAGGPARFSWQDSGQTVKGNWTFVDQSAGGVTKAGTPGAYVRTGKHLWDTAAGKMPSSEAACLVGVFRSPFGRFLGCLYLDTAGKLISYCPVESSGEPVTSTTPGLGFVTASSWTDANGLLHVYGLDADGTLKVLHQASWIGSVPQWSRSVPAPTIPLTPIGPATPGADRADGANPVHAASGVPACVGIVPGVSRFFMDPYPDSLPNQMVNLRSGASGEPRYAIHTQDLTSDCWTRDEIRLASAAAVRLTVSRYVSEVTVLDRRGKPMPGLTVQVSAETLTEIHVDGASHLVGPRHNAVLSTNFLGKVVIATAADDLLPATLYVNAIGLEQGAVIHPAAAVHDYLGGSGTLPSQQGTFTAETLSAATVGGKPVVDPKHRNSVDGVVAGIKNVFQMAEGEAPTSRLFQGQGPAPVIRGFAVCAAPGPDRGAPGPTGAGRTVEYTEFALDDEDAVTRHLEAIRGLPAYGGIWDDFANWAGDVWHGIASGVIEVYGVVVEAVSRVFVYVGEKIVELAGFVVDTIAAAVRTAESVFRQVVDSVGVVVDWLKALFAFQDIWDTKDALQDGIRTMLAFSTTVLDHVGATTDQWITARLAEITTTFGKMRADYADRPLGDAANQIPAVADGSGNPLSPPALGGSPQGNWLLNQAAAQQDPAVGRSLRPRFDPDSTIPAAFDRFLTKLTDSGVGDDILRILGDLGTRLATVADPNDPDGANKASMTALLDILQDVAGVVLPMLGTFVAALIELLKTVIDNIDDILDASMADNPLNAVYRWIQTSNGTKEPDVEDMTLGGLMCLLPAFSATTLFKLARGVDQAPFPGGVFPALKAPHFGGPAEPRAGVDADPADANRQLKNLQVFLALCGIGGLTFDVAGDLAPVLGTDWSKQTDLVLGLGSATFNATLFGMVGSCPPVTGTDWEDAGGAWSFAYFYALSYAVLSMAMLISGAETGTHVLKNARTPIVGPIGGPLLTGPLLATGCAALYIVGAAVGIHESKTNPYTAAAVILGAVPGAVQILRLGITKGSPESTARAGVVAVIDALSTLTSATMLTTAALSKNPSISSSPLPTGKVGAPYSHKIIAYGGDEIWNTPLKNWEIRSGSLPAGLSLGDDGTISGRPTTVQRATFTVRCSDSYGPPQYAEAVTLAIEILG